MQIATFNTYGLFNERAQRKLELILEYCILKDIAIMCQETFESTDPDLPRPTQAEVDYPSAWVVLSVSNTTLINRRGQMMLGTKAILQRYGLELAYLAHCSDDPDIEFLTSTLDTSSRSTSPAPRN